jgi:hypothetical protein
MTTPSVTTLVHESLGERVYKSDRAEHVSRAHSDHVLENALDFTNRAEPSPRFVGVHTAPGTAPRACAVPIAAAPSGRHWQA